MPTAFCGECTASNCDGCPANAGDYEGDYADTIEMPGADY